ncbi:hypothetical protein GCM10009682_15070 [Luedemannella flava]|uniref:Uncharacterized protein n=1 Tax=Luedemannella flava TaxID=349316 RepID=A0ABN2LN10_9ACTN
MIRVPYSVEEVLGGLRARTHATSRAVRRTAPGPALVRGLAGAFAVAVLLLAAPEPFVEVPWTWGIAVVLGAAVGLAPRSSVVTLVVLLVAVAWLTSTLVYQEPAPLWRLILVAAAIYPVHTGAALAAVLPYDAVVAPGVLSRWAGQTAAVLAGGVGIAVGGVLLASRVAGWSPLVAPILGLLAIAALAVVLAWLVGRR